MLPAPLLVVAKLASVLDALTIRYVVGGSVASSIYGIPRATQDVDLVADMKLSHVDAFTSALSGEFYVDADMISDAIRRRASFNVIHLATMFKADVFILQGDSWSREEMARAREEQLDVTEGQVTVRFASPEDTLLHKMIWYKLGNQISDRQWGDILGILKVQGKGWITSTSTGGHPCSTSWICFFAQERSRAHRRKEFEQAAQQAAAPDDAPSLAGLGRAPRG